MARKGGVAAVVVLGVEPDRENAAPFGVGAVEAGVGPFVGEGAVDLAIGLWPVGAGPLVDRSGTGQGVCERC